jgi:putative acetyltransferase
VIRITQIREETETDRDSVHALNLAAFDSPTEAELVDVLRVEASPAVSLVAEYQGNVIGHILFTPVEIVGNSAPRLMGLAPMAVLPDYQNRGVGSALVRHGIGWCGGLGIEAIVVLGHPDFYPRFGFRPASTFGLSCEFEVPDEAFMALELEPAALLDVSGRVRYHPAFANG